MQHTHVRDPIARVREHLEVLVAKEVQNTNMLALVHQAADTTLIQTSSTDKTG